MRILGGLVLLAGVGVGLFVYLPAPVDGDVSLDQVRRLAAAPTSGTLPPTASQAQPKGRSFSPSIPLPSAPRLQPSQRAVSSVKVLEAPEPGVPIEAKSGWQQVVSSSGAMTRGWSASLKPTNPDSRYKLVVELQQNLRRLGCYYGRIDGSWGPGSKDAMQTFTDRVNAALPIDEPDYVLLTLLQSHKGKTCGECPPGLTFSAGGRCVAQATVAQRQPGNSSRFGATQRETLPWKAASTNAAQPTARPLFTPLPTSVVSSEPLPGRMAIGGPKVLPPVDSLYAPTRPAATGADGRQVVASTAAANVSGAGARPPAASSHAAPPKYRQGGERSRRNGPGTVRYNLLLGLGGAY